MLKQKLLRSTCWNPGYLAAILLLLGLPTTTFAQDCDAGKIFTTDHEEYVEICLGQGDETEVEFAPDRPEMEFLYCLAVTDTAGTILSLVLTNTVDFG
ncbi:MAG: hypothetical protein AAF694_22595, partial [Bacteroidota bacterium]